MLWLWHHLTPVLVRNWENIKLEEKVAHDIKPNNYLRNCSCVCVCVCAWCGWYKETTHLKVISCHLAAQIFSNFGWIGSCDLQLEWLHSSLCSGCGTWNFRTFTISLHQPETLLLAIIWSYVRQLDVCPWSHVWQFDVCPSACQHVNVLTQKTNT